MKKLTLIILSLLAGPLAAQDYPEISDLTWADENYLNRQRASIEEITTFEFGSRLRKDKSDLRLLKRVIDEELVNQTEAQKQHALGVVLGDIYVTELNMEWKLYRDADGESQAVCLRRTEHCLFPVTMLSKRMKLGVKPDAYEMYQHGETLMKPYLPKLPYSVKKD